MRRNTTYFSTPRIVVFDLRLLRLQSLHFCSPQRHQFSEINS